MIIFGRLLGGASGSGEACLSLQILQSMVRNSNHALLPLRGSANLKGYALCRRPLWLLGLPLRALGAPILIFWETILAPRAHPGELF